MPLPVRWDIHKFILWAIIPLILVCLDIIQGKSKYNLDLISLTLLLLVILSFFSYFHATNSSLVFFPSFLFLGILNWVLLLKNDERVWKTMNFLFMFLFLTGIIRLVVFYLVTDNYDINGFSEYSGYNKNVLSTYFLCLWPFTWTISNQQKGKRIIDALSFMTIIAVLLLAESRGALIAFSVMCFLLLSRRYKRILPIIYGTLIITMLGFIFSSDQLYVHLEQLLNSTDQVGRAAYSLNSLDLFKNNILSGVGSGNLPISAYGNSELNDTYFISKSNLTDLIKIRDHNLYTMIIAELGIIGIVLFLTPIVILCYSYVHSKGQTSHAPLLSFIAYATTSIFYLTNYSFPYFFSITQLIGITSLALSIRSLRLPRLKIEVPASVILVFSLLTLAWFIYVKGSYLSYSNVRSSPEKHQLNELLSIYNPIFNTIGRNVNESIEFDLAKLYAKHANTSLDAIIFYNMAIENNPNNIEIMMFYGDYLVNKSDNYEEALEVYERAHELQPNFYPINVRLARLYLGFDDCKNSEKHMNRLYRAWNKQKFHVELIENIYYSGVCNAIDSESRAMLSVSDISAIRTISFELLSELDSIGWPSVSIADSRLKYIEEQIDLDELRILKTLDDKELRSYSLMKSRKRNDYLLQSFDLDKENVEGRDRLRLEIGHFGKEYLYLSYRQRLYLNDKDNFSAKVFLKKKNELIRSFKSNVISPRGDSYNESRVDWALRNYM